MKNNRPPAQPRMANQNIKYKNNILRIQPPSASDYAEYNQMKSNFLRENPTATHEEIQTANIGFAKLLGV